MVELLLTWKGTAPVVRSTLRRVYRWGTSIGHFDLVSKSWNAEQRTVVQESPVLERCTPISRAAPPIIVDDAWEEIVTDHGNYQSIEGSLLQIRMSTTNYKEKLALAIRLGCPIDSSTQLICEKELLDEVRPLLPMLPTLPASVPPVAPPASRPASRPAAPPVAPPASRPASRPAAPPASRPAAPPASRPSAPPPARPASRPLAPPATPPVSRHLFPAHEYSSLPLHQTKTLNLYTHASPHIHRHVQQSRGGVVSGHPRIDRGHRAPASPTEGFPSGWLGT